MITLIVSSVVLGLSIAAPVGPINVEIMRRGLTYGFWPALCVGLGGMSSDLLLMGAMFFGLGTILAWTWVQVVLMLTGCVVLVHSGLASLWSRVSTEIAVEEARTKQRGVPLTSYLKGAVIACTNPMNILFWVSIYGSVLSGALQQENIFRSFLISSMVFIGIGLWNMNLAFFVHFGRYLMKLSVLKWVQNAAALVLIYYGLKFGWQGLMIFKESGWM